MDTGIISNPQWIDPRTDEEFKDILMPLRTYKALVFYRKGNVLGVIYLLDNQANIVAQVGMYCIDDNYFYRHGYSGQLAGVAFGDNLYVRHDNKHYPMFYREVVKLQGEEAVQRRFLFWRYTAREKKISLIDAVTQAIREISIINERETRNELTVQAGIQMISLFKTLDQPGA